MIIPLACYSSPTPQTEDPVTCTNGSIVSKPVGQQDNGPDMLPGSSCNVCHKLLPGHELTISGTVYPTSHEPDNCKGEAKPTYTIEVTDSKGVKATIPVNDGGNQNGNFFFTGALTPPYKALVRSSTGAVRVMPFEVPIGDCNNCHTQFGAGGAPGRIKTPK